MCFQVQPKHVKEAFRLLNKSIIRVETPDINLEQEDEMEEEEEEQQQEGTDKSAHRDKMLHRRSTGIKCF